MMHKLGSMYNYLMFHPLLFIDCKEGKCIIVDTQSGNFLEVYDEETVKILEEAIEKKNYYISYIGKELMANRKVTDFVDMRFVT